MKILLAGAFGHLGSDILRELVRKGYDVVAADLNEKDVGVKGYAFKRFDATDISTVEGLCDGVDVVISTVGLTITSAKLTNYQVDYLGNKAILAEAKKKGVKHFTYVSVHGASSEAKDVPIVYAKYLFEEELKKSGVEYTIVQPTGYFYDIVHVFRPMIEKGEVTLLGKEPVKANVIDTPDLADFIIQHLDTHNKTYDIGGVETYSYEEIARMCFEYANKEAVIKYAPNFLFDVLAFINKLKRNGKEAIIKFSKWTLTHDMVGTTHYGTRSFKEYLKENFKG